MSCNSKTTLYWIDCHKHNWFKITSKCSIHSCHDMLYTFQSFTKAFMNLFKPSQRQCCVKKSLLPVSSEGYSCSSPWTHSLSLQPYWNCLHKQLWKMNVPIRCKNLFRSHTPVARKELWKDSDYSGSSLEHTHSQQRARKLCVKLLTQMLQQMCSKNNPHVKLCISLEAIGEKTG